MATWWAISGTGHPAQDEQGYPCVDTYNVAGVEAGSPTTFPGITLEEMMTEQTATKLCEALLRIASSIDALFVNETVIFMATHSETEVAIYEMAFAETLARYEAMRRGHSVRADGY